MCTSLPPPALRRARSSECGRSALEVEVSDRAEAAARAYTDAAADQRVLVKDGLAPAIAEGAGTIGVELERVGPLDTAIVQIGDGALISGVARWLKSRDPRIRVIGVCASGAPAMARSFDAGRPVAVEGTGTIAAALSITDPVPQSLERVRGAGGRDRPGRRRDLRSAMDLIADTMGVLVEPAGAAGVAALVRHRQQLEGNRVAVLLTGAGTPG